MMIMIIVIDDDQIKHVQMSVSPSACVFVCGHFLSNSDVGGCPLFVRCAIIQALSDFNIVKLDIQHISPSRILVRQLSSIVSKSTIMAV